MKRYLRECIARRNRRPSRQNLDRAGVVCCEQIDPSSNSYDFVNLKRDSAMNKAIWKGCQHCQ